MRDSWRFSTTLVLLTLSACAAPKYVPPPVPVPVSDTRKPLPISAVAVPSKTWPIKTYRDDGPGGSAAPPGGGGLTIQPTTPLDADASSGVGFDPKTIDTVLVMTPEVAPPDQGISLSDYNRYAAAVERGFMDAGCRVVDRRRLENLREEWKLKATEGTQAPPADSIALGKILNARAIVFAEHLSSTTSVRKFTWQTGVRQQSDRPLAGWVEARRVPELQMKGRTEWQYKDLGDQVFEVINSPPIVAVLPNRTVFPARFCLYKDMGTYGWRVRDTAKENTCCIMLAEAEPYSVVYFGHGTQPLYFPNQAIGWDITESDFLIHYNSFFLQISRESLAYFQSRVRDANREAAAFVALPDVNDDGAQIYESGDGASAGSRQEADLPISVVRLTCKVVLVETSQVAWIGTAELSYTDILSRPLSIPLQADGSLNQDLWPTADRQKAEILSKVFSFTAREFLKGVQAGAGAK